MTAGGSSITGAGEGYAEFVRHIQERRAAREAHERFRWQLAQARLRAAAAEGEPPSAEESSAAQSRDGNTIRLASPHESRRGAAAVPTILRPAN
jgi:hypothetical protein